MKANLLGYGDVDFTNKEGDHIAGTNVYLAIKDPSGKTMGLKAERLFVPENSDIINIDLKQYLGSEIDLEYGPKNKCYGISA